MTQASEPHDRNRETDRQLRDLRRRTERLEYSQISPQEFSTAFDRVYDKIYALKATINTRFDRLESDVERLNQNFGELNRKLDIAIQYITEQGGAN
jgi:predicted nuclease with TOPRIM domain